MLKDLSKMMGDYAEYRDNLLSYENEDEYSIDNDDAESTSSRERAELEIALYSQIHFEHDPSLDLTDQEVSQVLVEEEIPEVQEEHELNWRERLLGGLGGRPAKVGNEDDLKTPINTSKAKSKLSIETPVEEILSKPNGKKVKKPGEISKPAQTKPGKKQEKISDEAGKKDKVNQNSNKKSKLTQLIYREDPENKLASLEMKKTISKASTPRNQTSSRVIVELDSDDSDSSTGLSSEKKKRVFLEDLIVVDSISGSDSDIPGKANNPICLDSSDLDLSQIEPPVDTGGGQEKKQEEIVSSDSDDNDEDSSEDDDSSDDSIVELQPNTSIGEIQTNMTGVRMPVQRRQPLSASRVNTVSPDDLDLEDDNIMTIDDVHTSLGECDWSLVVADKFSGKPQTIGRYFRKLDVTCHNCKEKGHLSKICPKPRKVPVCLMCGEDGHLARTCPMSVCFNCQRVGHRKEDCEQPRRSLYAWCNRCGMQGHIKADCSDVWRQYHMTTEAGALNEDEMKQNTRVFCYNCATRGHWGHECEENFMDRFRFPQLPFVSYYSGTNASRDAPNIHGQKGLTRSERRKDKKHKKAFERLAQGKPQTKKQKKLSEGAFVRNALNAEKGAARGRAPAKKRKTQNEQFEAEYQMALKQAANNKKGKGKKYQTRGGVEAQHAGDFRRSKPKGQGRGDKQGHQSWNRSQDNSSYSQSFNESKGNKRKRKWNESNYHGAGGQSFHDNPPANKRQRSNKEKTQYRDNNTRPNRQRQKQKQKSAFTSDRGFRGYRH